MDERDGYRELIKKNIGFGLREREDLRQQILGFQGQPLVPQMEIRHDCAALVFLHAEYWHGFPLLSVSGHEETP